MGPTEREEIVFSSANRAPLVERMGELSRRGDGWVNVAPVAEDGAEPARSALSRLFGARRTESVLATWVPGQATRHGHTPASVGLQHGARTRVVSRLAEGGLPVPDRWRVTQDHPVRGLVASLPDDADLDQVLAWLIGAAELVSTVALTGRWRATVHRSE